MRIIKIKKWQAPMPNGEMREEDLLVAINALIGAKKPEDIPRGLDAFRIMGKVAQAFDDADKTGELKLEEREYTFLKGIIEKDIPCTWGFNKDLMAAIDDFLNTKEQGG